MRKINKIVSIITLFTLLIISNINIHAAGFTIAANKTQVKAGESFTVTIQGNVAGRFDASVSNGTLNTTSIFIDAPGASGGFTVTPNGAGDIYVTITATDVSEGGTYEAVTGSQGVNVRLLVPSGNTGQPSNNNAQNKPIEPTVKDENTNVMPISEDTDSLVQPRNILPTIGTDAMSMQYKNEKILVLTTLDKFNTKKGFKSEKLKLKKAINTIKEIEVLRHIKNDFLLVRGMSEKNQDENLYLFDKDKNALIGLVSKIHINNKDYSYINALDNKTYMKEKFNNSLFKIVKNEKVSKNKLDVLEYKDKKKDNYKILYVMDENGNFEWIQYETNSDTFQPFVMPLVENTNLKANASTRNNQKTMERVVIAGALFSVINLILLLLNIRKDKQLKKKLKQINQIDNECNLIRPDISVETEDTTDTEEDNKNSNTETIVMDKTEMEIPDEEYIQTEDIDVERVVLEFIKMQTRDDLEKSERLLNDVLHPTENETDEEINKKLNDFIKLNNKLLYLVSNQLKIAKYPNVEINKIITAGKKGYYKTISEIEPSQTVTQDTLFKFRKEAVSKIIQAIDNEFK